MSANAPAVVRTSFPPVLVSLAAMLLHAAILMLFVRGYAGDVSSLVCVDEAKIGIWPFEAITTGFPSPGFDGQFYYILARNPWQKQDPSLFDQVAYRHARVLYPVLGWIGSGGGEPTRLLWVLPLINLLCIAGLAGIGAGLARHYGRNPWWGLLLPIVVNAGAPMLRDLTDPLGMFAACALMAGWYLGWSTWLLTLAGVAAVLSREQNIALLGIIFLDAWRTRRRGAMLGMFVSGLVGCGWLLALRCIFGLSPVGSGNLDMPFAGMAYRWMNLRGASGSPVHAAGMAMVSMQVWLCAVLIYRGAKPATGLLAVAGMVLAVCGGVAIYQDGTSYTRVFFWMPLAIWMGSMQRGSFLPIWLLTPALAWPLYLIAKSG